MLKRPHNPAEVAQELRQIEDFFGRGIHRLDAIREVRLTEQTRSISWAMPRATASL